MRTYDLSMNRDTMTPSTYGAIVGRAAIYTTAEGVQMVGTVEAPKAGDYPLIRFADGRWARCGDTIELLDA